MIEETFQILREEKETFKKRFFKAANNATIVLRIFVILGKFLRVFVGCTQIVVATLMTLSFTRCSVGV